MLGAELIPIFISWVRGAYMMGQMSRVLMAEAHEQVHHIVAEVHAEGDVDPAATKAAAASGPTS
jgi:hypothetical protein